MLRPYRDIFGLQVATYLSATPNYGREKLIHRTLSKKL
jgi:hypothetical protein